MHKKVLAVLASLGLALLSEPACSQTSASRIVDGHFNVPNSHWANCGTVGPCYIPSIPAVPLGYQQLTSLASSTALTVPSGAIEAFIVCTGQTVNWRDDGVAPTASVGVPLPVSVGFPYTGNLAALRLIQTTATATCNIAYYG